MGQRLANNGQSPNSFPLIFTFIYSFGRLSCGMWDPAPRPGIEPGRPCIGSSSPSRRTTREVPRSPVFVNTNILCYGSCAQSCLTLCDPMDCSLPGSSVHGISQARILEWVPISFSRRSSWHRDWPQVSCIAGRFFTSWGTREAHIELEPVPFINVSSVATFALEGQRRAVATKTLYLTKSKIFAVLPLQKMWVDL